MDLTDHHHFALSEAVSAIRVMATVAGLGSVVFYR